MRDNSEPKQKIPKEKKDKKILIKLQKEKNHSTNTIPSIKETLEEQSKYQTINQISKSFNMTMDENKINIKENSKPKTRNISKISKIPSSLIHNNNESSLLKNLQFLDSDNVKLREALKEINKELQQKEEALNESQKLIKKINNEYTQILNQYKAIEEEKAYFKKDNERLQKICNILTKNLNNKEKKEKQNEKIKAELIKTKELLNNLKNNYNSDKNDFNKKEKDIKYKEMIIKDLKSEGNKIVNMLQDRDLLIREYNIKINELNDIIKQKDEQLKLMLNFSKELNNENKTNIKEITKQAVKTINTLYNARKNKEEENKINLIQIKSDLKSNNNDENNKIDIITKKNCSFLINKAIKRDIFIPDIELKTINKEFLEANNIKISLIKTEIFSSILREFHLFEYINDFFNKSNENLKNLNLPKNDKQDKSIKAFKNCYDKIVNCLIKYKKENSFLKSKINEITLYINKLQNDFSNKNKKIKEKFERLQNQYLLYLKKLETKDKNIINLENNTDNKDINYSKEISELNKEIDKINNINHNLNDELLNKDEIINKLRNENNKLNNKINLYRTNPNAENNIKFYNSYSTKANSINPKNLLSENYYFQYNKPDDLKLNTYKVLSQNNIFDSFNNNDDLSKNTQEFSTNIKSDNDNLMKFKTQNYNNENYDFSKTYIKSNNYNNNNFVNLVIQVQDEFSYNSNHNIMNNIQKNCSSNIDNSYLNNIENKNNISTIIKNFTQKINEDQFIDIINKIFSSNNIILMLNNKIGEIKNNLSQIKEKFRNNNKEKKIKPSQLIDVIDEVEKLLFYLFNQLNKFNIDSQSIFPFLKIIFNMVSTISFNNPLEINNINNNLYNITPINIDINTLINTTSSNYNNKFNSKKNFKDKILQNTINQNKSEINLHVFNNIFYINNKIFSSSELIKYYSIYEGLDISELISVFREICDNFKNIILNSKFNYDTDLSDFEENNDDIGKPKDNEIITENNTYHIVNEKIFGLKKFEFNFKLFFELLKNYLVVFEIVVKQIEINIQNNQRKKELKNVLNNLYEIFEDSSYLNIDNYDDNTIFCRKILLTLLLNQKEYLSNFI